MKSLSDMILSLTKVGVAVALALVNCGYLPVDRMKQAEAGLGTGCSAKVACLTKFGWCIVAPGSVVGSCTVWGVFCSPGAVCPGTFASSSPAPIIPLAPCNAATGC